MCRLCIFFSTAAALAGCRSSDSCAGLGGSSLLYQRAALLRLAVYGADARCDGSRVAAGASPILSGDFQPGQAIRIDVPPGRHVVVLSAFGDTAATELLGSACEATDVAPGAAICLDLTLVASPDAAAVDAAAPVDAARPVDATPPADASRPPDLACGVGCPCAKPSDCAAPLACCAGRCADTTTDRANCGACGAGCDGPNAAGSSCVAASCSYQCVPGFGDCHAAPPNLDGCETPLDTLADCTACGVACDQATTVGAACGQGGCTYAGCQPGHVDCNAAAPNADGCECATPACCGTSCQTTHTNGFGGTFYDCGLLGSYDVNLATEACAAFTGDASKCHVGGGCTGNKKAVCSDGANVCICWGYAGGVAGLAQGGNSNVCACPVGNSVPWK